MIVSLFENPSSVDGKELDEDLMLLPEWRRKKVLSYRFLTDRVLCAKAYLLLKNGLRDSYGIDDNPVFDYICNGKPVLRDYPGIHFNLSHCKRGVLCVIDNSPVGCDIEEIGESFDIQLCRFCNNDSETSGILSSANPCIEFTRLWTMKESYLKLSGEGLTDSLQSLLSSDVVSRLAFETTVCPEKGFAYSICKFNNHFKI